MANRRFQRLQALDREVKLLYVEVVTDGSGDVTSFSGLGVSDVSHSSNDYTVTLEDKYFDFKFADAISSVSADWTVDSEDVNGAKTIVLGSSVAQASTTIYFKIEVKNSSVVR